MPEQIYLTMMHCRNFRAVLIVASSLKKAEEKIESFFKHTRDDQDYYFTVQELPIDDGTITAISGNLWRYNHRAEMVYPICERCEKPGHTKKECPAVFDWKTKTFVEKGD